MELTAIHPRDVAGEMGAWSHAISIDLRAATRLVFVSGQTAYDEQGRLVGKDDFGAQFAQVYRNLQRVVTAAGGTMRSIVSYRSFLTRAEDAAVFRAMRDRLHEGVYPDGRYPTNTLAVVDRLAEPELRLEIEAVLAL